MEIQYYEHTCKCGCGGQIKIKKNHKYSGIPFYINGHGFKGKKHTKEARQKQREESIGKIIPQEVRQKISETKIKNGTAKGENNPFFGKKHTSEARQKIGEKSKCKIQSQEARQKISIGNKGHIVSEETRQKISIGNKGKKRTLEQIQKIKEAITVKFGEDSPNWNNGSSFLPYASKFNKELKQSILERDNYICQCPNCESKSKRLAIHHIDYDKNNSNPENLITLCNSCHTKTNGKNKRQYYKEFYQNIMIDKLMECLL